MLECKNIFKSYEGKEVLSNFSISLKKGSVTCILGRSGIGKSTLARILSLFDSPDKGSIYLNGEDISVLKGKEKRILRKRIQLVFQNPLSSFDPRWSIKRSLKEANPEISDDDIKNKLDSFSLGYLDIESKPENVSGGELQRIAILRALLANPEVIIADEVTSSLDAINRKIVLDMLLEAKSKDTAILFITHDRDAAIYIADYIIEMEGKA